MICGLKREMPAADIIAFFRSKSNTKFIMTVKTDLNDSPLNYAPVDIILRKTGRIAVPVIYEEKKT